MDQSNSNTIEGSRKLGHHLTLDERGMIQALHEQGYSLRGIAAAVGCAHTTVHYEQIMMTFFDGSLGVVLTLPFITNCGVEHQSVKAVVAECQSIRLSADSRRTRNIAGMLDVPVNLTAITASPSSNGWWNMSARSGGHWIPVSAMPGCKTCFSRSRFPAPKRSTICSGLASCRFLFLMFRRRWGVSSTENGIARTNA